MMDVVCALIENEQGQLLACKRAETTHLGGHWEFPGGKIEPGESAQDALIREIAEELGVVIEVGSSMKPVEWSDGRVAILLHPFCCRILSGELHPHEHDEIRWCDSTQLEGLNWAPADLPILEEWLCA